MYKNVTSPKTSTYCGEKSIIPSRSYLKNLIFNHYVWTWRFVIRLKNNNCTVQTCIHTCRRNIYPNSRFVCRTLSLIRCTAVTGSMSAVLTKQEPWRIAKKNDACEAIQCGRQQQMYNCSAIQHVSDDDG